VLPFSSQVATIERQAKRRSGMQYPPTVIGQHLVKVRNARNLTRKSAAEQMGVNQQALGGWERGTSSPDIQNMRKVIDFLGYYPFPEPTTFAGKIKKYRQVHGLTFFDFGKLFDVSEPTVWTWENEKYVPGDAIITKIFEFISS